MATAMFSAISRSTTRVGSGMMSMATTTAISTTSASSGRSMPRTRALQLPGFRAALMPAPR